MLDLPQWGYSDWQKRHPHPFVEYLQYLPHFDDKLDVGAL